MITIKTVDDGVHIEYTSPLYGTIASTTKPTLSAAIEDLVTVFKEHQDACITELRDNGLIRTTVLEAEKGLSS